MFFTTRSEPILLAIGAHPDDVELGAGGFVHRLKRELNARVRLVILTHGLRSRALSCDFDQDQRHQESIKAAEVLGIHESDVTILDYQDCGLHKDRHSLIREIERLIGSEKFDIVLTHAKGDTHNDHVAVYEATISAARNFDGTVLLYQAPSTIPNEFRPTSFVELKGEDLEAKKTALRQHVSQREKAFMSEQRIQGVANSWAIFLNEPTSVFEAFEVHKSFWR